MGFTTAQLAAIDECGKTVLVSAAAGSGKTFTLTQRIIKRIIEDGADIQRMLIVTFTRAAAAELKSRIASALSEQIAKHPENQNLQKQMIMMSGANICTIDSFFIDPVKSNFDKLGLPARVRLADSAELDSIREECFAETIERMYIKRGIGFDTKISDIRDRNDFSDLIYLLTSSRGTHKLFSILFGLYTKLITSPDGVEILKHNSERLMRDSERDFFESAEGEVIRQDILYSLGVCLNTFEYYKNRLDEDVFVKEKYIFNFTENCDMCAALINRIQNCRFCELESAFEVYSPSRMASIKKSDVTPFSEECKEARAATHKKINEIKKKYLSYNSDGISQDYLFMSKINLLLYEIISYFDKCYSKAKKDMGLFEFSDTPRFLLEILGNGDSPIAKQMQDMYDEVYIDEYQDVNEIQDTIFKIIGQNHRFMVGDIKQSIYGFRDAMPELFTNYKNTFPLYTNKEAVEEVGGCTIFMSENFRCDQNVISFSNAVCSSLFEASEKAVNYTKNDDLVFNKLGLEDSYISPKVKINIFDEAEYEDILVEKEDDSTDQKDIVTEKDVNDTDIPNEAIYCAKEILRLVKTESKPNGQPVSFGDIAVLVRVKHHAPIVAAALKKFGIEYCLSASNQLFDGQDMKSLLDLLRVIDNPEDDLSMCAFLTTSAYLGEPLFSLEEIVTIRQASSVQKSLWRALIEYSDISDPLATLLCHRVHDVIEILKSLRALSRRVSADKLLKTIKSMPEFKVVCESQAYTYLYDCACGYVKTQWNGLYNFLKYYKKLAESGNVSLKEASSTNAVNIMTIHQSKGLEYHAVFVYGCSRPFSTKESRASLNYSRSLCAATKSLVEFEDEEQKLCLGGTRENLIKRAVIKKIYHESLFEEMRILYVALTRARERLYVSATIKESFDDFKTRIKMMGASPAAVMSQNSFIEWIISSLMRGNTNYDTQSFELYIHSAIKLIQIEEEATKQNEQTFSASERELEYVNIINSNHEDRDDKLLSQIPSKIAASKAKNNLLDESISLSDDKTSDIETIRARIELMRSQRSDFDSLLSKTNTPTAADIGTATHSFLQFCDYNRVTENGIDAEIEYLVEQKFISKAYADIIDKKQIRMFFESKLFQDIQSSDMIKREFKFGIFKNASEFTQNPEWQKKLSDTQIYIQGAIDLILFDSDGNITVCDYKTDRILPEERQDISKFITRLSQRHKNQISQYDFAIRSIFGKAPSKLLIYSMPLGRAIEITL